MGPEKSEEAMSTPKIRRTLGFSQATDCHWRWRWSMWGGGGLGVNLGLLWVILEAWRGTGLMRKENEVNL